MSVRVIARFANVCWQKHKFNMRASARRVALDHGHIGNLIEVAL